MYFLGAFSIKEGFPPIYKESKSILDLIMTKRGEVFDDMRWIFVAFGVLVSAFFLTSFTGFDEFLLLPPAGFFCAGWSIRTKLKRTSGGPLPWVTVYTASPLLFPLFDRRPMLLFDIWTLAATGIFGLPLVAIAFLKG